MEIVEVYKAMISAHEKCEEYKRQYEDLASLIEHTEWHRGLQNRRDRRDVLRRIEQDKENSPQLKDFANNYEFNYKECMRLAALLQGEAAFKVLSDAELEEVLDQYGIREEPRRGTEPGA